MIGLEIGDRAGAARGDLPESFESEVRAGQSIVAQVWTRWQTAADESVCPECGPLDGIAWPADDGPVPPLHTHCRCRRTPAFIEWSTARQEEER